jgi:hypothetical protein
MISVPKRVFVYPSVDSQGQESQWVVRYSNDDPPVYQERRQKDMPLENPHYHWDWIDWSCCGDE